MDILMIVIVIPIVIDSVKIEDIQEEEGITKKEVEGHLIEKITRVEVIQEEEDPLIMEDHLMMEDHSDDGGPLTMEDHLMMEDPQMMEDPLMMEDPQEMEDCQEDLEDKDCQGPPGPPGPVHHIIVQQPQVTLDTTTAGKYFWNSWPVNATIS